MLCPCDHGMGGVCPPFGFAQSPYPPNACMVQHVDTMPPPLMPPGGYPGQWTTGPLPTQTPSYAAQHSLQGFTAGHVPQDAPQPSLALQLQGEASKAGQHHALGDKYIALHRSALPHVHMRCVRDARCSKENGHRGRCSLTHKPRDEDINHLKGHVASLQAELAEAQARRESTKKEIATLDGKVSQVCKLLGKLVRDHRTASTGASGRISSAEVKGSLMAMSTERNTEAAEQEVRSCFARAIALRSAAHHHSGDNTQSLALARSNEEENYTRQFEKEVASVREALARAAERAAMEVVPIIVRCEEERMRQRAHQPGLDDVLHSYRQRMSMSLKRSRILEAPAGSDAPATLVGSISVPRESDASGDAS